jgi:hypothetical protein
MSGATLHGAGPRVSAARRGPAATPRPAPQPFRRPGGRAGRLVLALRGWGVRSKGESAPQANRPGPIRASGHRRGAAPRGPPPRRPSKASKDGAVPRKEGRSPRGPAHGLLLRAPGRAAAASGRAGHRRPARRRESENACTERGARAQGRRRANRARPPRSLHSSAQLAARRSVGRGRTAAVLTFRSHVKRAAPCNQGPRRACRRRPPAAARWARHGPRNTARRAARGPSRAGPAAL